MNAKNDSKVRPKRGRGRPQSASGGFKIIPVPHQLPDSEKLARALLSLALHQAERHIKTPSEAAQRVSDEVA